MSRGGILFQKIPPPINILTQIAYLLPVPFSLFLISYIWDNESLRKTVLIEKQITEQNRTLTE